MSTAPDAGPGTGLGAGPGLDPESSPGGAAAAPRVVQLLERAQLRFAMAVLVVMMMTTVAEVIARYLFGHPIRGAYDIVEVCLAVFVANGTATVFLRRQNIVIDLIDRLVSPRAAGILIRIGELLMIAVLLTMIAAMITPALQAYDYGDRKLELGLPVYIVWIFALAGFAGAALCAAGSLLRAPERTHGLDP